MKNKINLLNYMERRLGTKAKNIGGNKYRINPCPVCGKKDHFTVYADTNSYSSFSGCCNGGSILDYLMEVEGLEWDDAVNRAKELLGIKINEKKEVYSLKDSEGTVVQGTKEVNEEYDFTSLIESLSQNKTDYYYARGLTDKTIKKYKLGYSSNGYNAILKDFPELKVTFLNEKDYKYILPLWDVDNRCRYFITRNSKNNRPKTLNMKKLGGKNTARIFNDRYIYNPDLTEKYIFITEGIFDALAIEEFDYHAIALNSTAQANNFIHLVAANLEKLKDKTFIVVGDNDEAGQELNAKLLKELTSHNLKPEAFRFNKKYKDLNEYLVDDRKAFESHIKEFINNIGSEDLVINYILDEFMQNIEKMNKNQAIPTGFPELDKLLGGGLYAGLYILGAISSLGKTTFVQQIADNIAAEGTYVLFFSLEMSKFEMLAKSISRQSIIINSREARSAREIMNGINTNQNVLNAVIQYAETTAQYVSIIEGDFDTGVNEIRERIKKHLFYKESKPVVIVDYLQILKGLDYRMTDKQRIDANVTELKRISRDFNIPLIVISSLNRMNYTIPISFESFKESGAIEYTADVILGLQPARIYEIAEIRKESEKRKALNEAKIAEPRKIELVCLKNRNGSPYFTQCYDYYSKNNYFIEVKRYYYG